MVTVGIPFRNCKDTFQMAIRSIFAQTYEDWELLLVDDGSADGSLEIAKSISDSRVQVISDGEHKGLSFRLNQIANEARASYLARMDADDIMHPQRLEMQVRYLEDNPDIDVVGTGAYIIDSNNFPTRMRKQAAIDLRPETVIKHGWVVHPSVTAKTQWFRNNPYDGSFVRAEDHELWCKTCKTSKFAKLPQLLYFYRENSRDPRAYLGDYISSSRTYRKIIRKYGPKIIGWHGTLSLILQSMAKEQAYRIFTVLGLQSNLINRRSEPLTNTQLQEALSALQIIFNTTVPGLAGESKNACF